LVVSNQNQDSNLGSRLQQDLKNDLIAGLLVVIPLATTIWLSSLVSNFVEKYAFPAIRANALYLDKYPLSTALARP